MQQPTKPPVPTRRVFYYVWSSLQGSLAHWELAYIVITMGPGMGPGMGPVRKNDNEATWGSESTLAGIEITFQHSRTPTTWFTTIWSQETKKLSEKPLFSASPLLRGELKCNEESLWWLASQLRRNDPTNSPQSSIRQRMWHKPRLSEKLTQAVWLLYLFK